ncbi:MAG: guanitoxin biosynthesis MBL fold metallo-hydrolase GntH [Xanthomonadales bacterium]|nr:guanitoxin biosynthesis MBL fold metallo-hydrolase GntH [Xanthomonadales bacterium]
MKIRMTWKWTISFAMCILAVNTNFAADTDANLRTPLGIVDPAETRASTNPITELGHERSFYLAGSEQLGENEMRVISLGSGMPQIQRNQASACWLVQLGNGDSFIFDIGSGCTPNMSMLELPWDTFTKVFITHLHSDHFGDLPTLLAGGWQMGRSIPLEVWGPSGLTPDLGTEAAVEHLLGMFRWEYVSKNGRAPMSSYAIKIHEFDYAKEQVVYERNDVIIRSWPAVHVMDGPVSYSLEWNGLKFSYSGDTVANNWFLKNAKNSDIVIHECSDPIEVLIESRSWPPEAAWMIATSAHTQPELAGQLFNLLKPRMAVCFHYVDNGLDSGQKLSAAVREIYQGPFSVAEDMMVWNITPETIRVRRVIGGEFAFSLPRGKELPDKSKLVPASDWIEQERMDATDAYRRVLENLKPEYRKRILEKVPQDMLP